MAIDTERFMITEEEALIHGVEGMPDVPGFPAQKMQKRLDELAKFIGTEKLNGLLSEMAKPLDGVLTEREVRAAIGEAEFTAGSGDMQRNIYDPGNRAEDVFQKLDELEAGLGGWSTGSFTNPSPSILTSHTIAYRYNPALKILNIDGFCSASGDTILNTVALCNISDIPGISLPGQNKSINGGMNFRTSANSTYLSVSCTLSTDGAIKHNSGIPRQAAFINLWMVVDW